MIGQGHPQAQYSHQQVVDDAGHATKPDTMDSIRQQEAYQESKGKNDSPTSHSILTPPTHRTLTFAAYTETSKRPPAWLLSESSKNAELTVINIQVRAKQLEINPDQTLADTILGAKQLLHTAPAKGAAKVYWDALTISLGNIYGEENGHAKLIEIYRTLPSTVQNWLQGEKWDD